MTDAISSRLVGNTKILDMHGHLYRGASVEGLREEVKSAIANKQSVLLNATDVSHLDSSGIGELVSSHTALKDKGLVFGISDPQKRVLDKIVISKLSGVLNIYPDEKTALEQIATPNLPGAQVAAGEAAVTEYNGPR